MASPDYAYYYNSQRHTQTTTDYLKNLGLDEKGIKSLQDSAKWNSARESNAIPL